MYFPIRSLVVEAGRPNQVAVGHPNQVVAVRRDFEVAVPSRHIAGVVVAVPNCSEAGPSCSGVGVGPRVVGEAGPNSKAHMAGDFDEAGKGVGVQAGDCWAFSC